MMILEVSNCILMNAFFDDSEFRSMGTFLQGRSKISTSKRVLVPVNVVLVFFFFTGAVVVVVAVDVCVVRFSCVDSDVDDTDDEDDSCFGLWLEAVFFFSLFLVGAELLKGWSSKIE